MEVYDRRAEAATGSSQSRTALFELPAEIRLQILNFTCPLPISLVELSSPNNTGEIVQAEEVCYVVNDTHAITRNMQARGDFERLIRIAETCAAMRFDMLVVIEQRHRLLENLDSTMKSLLNTDDPRTQWVGAVYRMWLRDEWILHEYVYYCFRVGLPIVSDIKNAGYQLQKLQSSVAKHGLLDPLANFSIPHPPTGKAVTSKTTVIESRKRKLSDSSSRQVKDPTSWRSVDEDWRLSNAQTCQTVPLHTVQSMKQRNYLPKGPVDEIENGNLFYAT